MSPIRGPSAYGLLLGHFLRNNRTCEKATNPARGQVRMAAVMKTPGQPRSSQPRPDQHPWHRLLAGALAGVLTGAVALGVAELTAAITGPLGAPVIAVGETAINLTPVPVKDFAIAHFGSHDKEALITGIVVLLVAFAALIGVLAVRRMAYGLAGLAIFAGVGVAAAAHLPNATAADVTPTLAGVGVAVAALVVLVRAVWAAFPAAEGPAPSRAAPLDGITSTKHHPEDTPRRRPHARPGSPPFPDRGGGNGGAGRGGRRSRRPADGTVQRRPGAGPAARPGGRGQGGPGGHRPADRRADPLLHLEQQLLPGRHGPGPAAGIAGKLDAADRRHGRPGARHHLRRAAARCR